MDIGKHFSISKKKKNNLGDNSKKEADSKEDKEATSSSSYRDPDGFGEGLHPFLIA